MTLSWPTSNTVNIFCRTDTRKPSTHDNIASWVNVRTVPVRVRVLYAGPEGGSSTCWEGYTLGVAAAASLGDCRGGGRGSLVSAVGTAFWACSTLGCGRAANRGDRRGGATVGVGGNCRGGTTLGGGSALGNRRGNMGGGRGDAATATVGHATISPFSVTLVVRRGERRGGGRWCFSVGAVLRGLNIGISTGGGFVPGCCWLLFAAWRKMSCMPARA